MNEANHHGWYDIMKDIVIPFLGVAATIVIGIVVAGILKRKEEKAKIKSLLIDSYMKFLDKKVNFVGSEYIVCARTLFREFYDDYDNFFGKDANSHIPKSLIRKRVDDLQQRLERISKEDSNWSMFTYQFAFLLGSKRYKKEVQGLENSLVSAFIQEEPRKKFINDLEESIKEDDALKTLMNSVNETKIEKALDQIENKVAIEYTKFQNKAFQAYENKIADLIDAY